MPEVDKIHVPSFLELDLGRRLLLRPRFSMLRGPRGPPVQDAR